LSLLQTPSLPASRFPEQPLSHLDALWIQVAGTLCNLACTHCFVTSGPSNARHPMMSRDEIRQRIREALPLGLKEIYFTGGEPFLHPEMVEILEDSMPQAPCTVLTNGTLFTARRLERLRALSEGSRHSLEIRVSLDGYRAEDHDAFRGPGMFTRAIQGLIQCEAYELLPIVTVTQNTDEDPVAFRERYIAMLRDAGIQRPRLKVLPMFRLGREVARSGPYRPVESLAGVSAAEIEGVRLQCGTCRAVTAKGVYVCPLLVEESGGRMGDRFDQALGPFTLRHGACYTCYVTGMTCANS